jgi:predicted DNA-binding protein
MAKHKEVSNTEILASVILGSGKTLTVDAVRPISYRIPIRLLARIDALADKSSKSRNFIITSLIEIGLDDLTPHLGDEGMQEILSRESVHMHEMMGSGDIESQRED